MERISDQRVSGLMAHLAGEPTDQPTNLRTLRKDIISALRELKALRDAAQPNFTCQSCGAMFCVKVPSQLTAEQFLEGVTRCSRCVEVEQLSGELLALREESKWIAVTKHSPEMHDKFKGSAWVDVSDGRTVLVAQRRLLSANFDTGDEQYGWWATNGTRLDERCVHFWRPRPAPPTEDTDGG